MVSETAVVAEAGTYAPATAQWVVFRCSGRRFGFPLERVSEILTPRTFTRLPGAVAGVCGLVGFRGRVITVFDLGVVLELDSAAASFPDHRLLLLKLGTRRIGAAVDEVERIVSARLTPARAAGGARWVMGTARAEDGEFVALEPQELLRDLLQN